MLDAAPAGLPNRGVDANRLNDLLTFMSNAILKSSKEIFGMGKPSKFWNNEILLGTPEVVHLQN